MQRRSNSFDLDLAAQVAFKRRHARGWRFSCLEGRVWISLEGQFDDVFLAPGENYAATGSGLLIVEGIGPARLRIEAPTSLYRRLLSIRRKDPAPSGASSPA